MNIEKIKVQYWDKISYTSISSEVKREEEWEGSKEDIFKQFDAKNNSLRYCNGSFYQFADSAIQEEYIKWYKSLPENVKFDMYYGNGIVD